MLYNPRNYQKSINKSIRLSQPVYDYIMQAPGDGFNQKFENIIIDAKESEARRQETLKMLDDRIEDLQADYNSCYDKLRKLAPMVQVAMRYSREADKAGRIRLSGASGQSHRGRGQPFHKRRCERRSESPQSG